MAAETLVTRAVTAVKMKVELFLRKAVVGWKVAWMLLQTSENLRWRFPLLM